MNIDMEFKGMRWQMPEVAQSAQWATTAHNMYRINSALEPLRAGAKSTLLPTADFRFARSMYLHDDKFVATENRLDFATTEVVGDKSRRMYFVENGLLQFLAYNEIPTNYPTPTINGHRSGVPAPISLAGFNPKPFVLSQIRESANADDTTNATLISFDELPENEKRNYIETAFRYTYVNKYGEEGPPSIVSNAVMARPDVTNITMGNILYTTNPDVVGIRLYMLVDGGWFRVVEPEVKIAETATTAEIPNLTFLNDNSGAFEVPGPELVFSPASVQEEGITDGWFQAPNELKHMATLDNGVLAVAGDHDIYLSEPYYWHAFREESRYAVKGTIQRIVNVGGGFAVLTDRGTQFFFGASPDAMIRSERSFPHSIRDPDSFTQMDDGGIYVCDDGIAYISSAGGSIITDGWIDREHWRERIKLDECRTEMYEGRVLIATRIPQNSDPIGYCLNLEIGEATSFDLSESALKSGFFRDPRNNEVSYVTDAAGMTVYNRGNQLVALWESGDIWLPRTISLNSLYVESDEYPVTVKVTPKDRLARTMTVESQRPRRMPVTGRAKSVRVRVESGQQVGRCSLGTDMRSF